MMSLTYLICRIHGYVPKFLTREMLLDLASARTLREFVEKLSRTDYGQKLEGTRTLREIENSLTEVFVNKLRAVLKVASERTQTFLKAYLRRYEVQNLILVLRMKAGKASKEEIERLLIPVGELGELKLEPILEAKSLEQALEIIRRSKRYLLPKKVENILVLEISLWKDYYIALLKNISKAPLQDRKDMKKFIGLEIDFHNLKTCLLTMDEAIKLSDAEKLLIRNPVGISHRRLLSLVKERAKDLLLELSHNYRGYLEKFVSGELWLAEIERYKILKNYMDALRIPKFINFFYVMKYLLDLEIEYRNLRSIAISIYHELPVDARTRLLIT
ncbi:MAG: hypothetical protein DRJ69_00745 [Thermoprotei archaeon]|nr:MAG: hypothetical protein DRJ69_00745 [Thermoprotei archaeon]